MKKWLTYLLIPVMLIQCNMTLVICTSFYYNQKYIEKYLCVQRNMEHNTCHGKCYLMKKLKAQQENEQKNFKVNFHESLAVDHFQNEVDLCTTVTELAKTYPLYFCNLNPQDYIYSIDHPPLFI